MPRLRNLVPNPACAVNATGWASAPAGYARSTSVDALLPRTTGFEGTGAAAVLNTPQFLCTAGQTIVISVSIKALAAQPNISLIPFFLDAPSGGNVLTYVGLQTVNLAAGAIERYVISVDVPTGAQSCILQMQNIQAGGVEITGLRACPASVVFNEDGVDIGNLADDGTYYDGASPNWIWEGTAGSSTSARTYVEDIVPVVDAFSVFKTIDANGRIAEDIVPIVENFSIAASGTFGDIIGVQDGFLIAQLIFDSANARLRINAFTFSASVTHVLVMRRTANGKYALIRGGDVPVYGGKFARTVDDYEYDPGQVIYYRIQGLADDGSVVQEATVRRDGFGLDDSWLKVIAKPQYNQRIRLVDWSEFEYKARASSYQVQGRADRVFTNDVHDLKTTEVTFLTLTPAETDFLALALTRGTPIYLQIPGVQDFPSMYASVGDIKTRNPKKKNSGHKLFTVPVTEIAMPSAAIFASLTTWQTVSDNYASWQALLDAYSTWEELAAS